MQNILARNYLRLDVMCRRFKLVTSKRYKWKPNYRVVICMTVIISFLITLKWTVIAGEGIAEVIQRYDVFELKLQGSAFQNPYTQAPSTEVTFFGPNHTSIIVSAFWNGGAEWRVRFTPSQAGTWNYSVTSGDPKINGHTGSFRVSRVMGGLNGHGMIEVDPSHPHKFRYTDGTPFFFLGHSIDWYRQGGLASGQYKEIVKARAHQGFTVLVGYAGPTLGKPFCSSNESGPPFLDTSLDRINPAYFQEVDERLRIAVDNGLAVTMALSFADQGIWKLDKFKLERAWKYTIARYAAYPIFWQPIGEYDEDSVSRAREIGRITDTLDCYNHPQSMHPRITSAEFAGESWFDFIIHQTLSKIAPIDLIRNEYANDLPIVEEEHRVSDVNLVRKAAWRHYTNGAYYTLTMANYVISDKRTEQISYFMKFINETSFQDLEPHPGLVDHGDCIAKLGEEYVIYFLAGGRVWVNLSTAGPLNVRWYNPRKGKYMAADSITGGTPRFFTAPDRKDWVLHIKKEAFNSLTQPPKS
jgi:hypothetical protein